TDRQLLEQILKNLLSNAFKFTEQGSVELGIARDQRRTKACIAFAVTDTGIGVAPDQHERIFEAFQQADTSITRRFGGTGLGLTISREYARVLGGEITLSSAPRGGSTFTLFLPLTESAAQAAEPEVAPGRHEAAAPLPDDVAVLAKKKILI